MGEEPEVSGQPWAPARECRREHEGGGRLTDANCMEYRNHPK